MGMRKEMKAAAVSVVASGIIARRGSGTECWSC